MWRKLLEVLVSPVDGQPLRLEQDSGEDPVMDGVLVSASGDRFPIVRGVPRFVDTENYTSSFGLQWNRFAEVQLDSVAHVGESRRRFDAEVSWAGDIGGHWVVDAGCGSGRFAEVAAAYGAEVIAVDASSAVDAAMTNLGAARNLHVIQADIRHLPLRAGAVRYLYSIGVLQHTPDPVATARCLVEQLPAGGRFCFTVYGRHPWTKLFSKYWLRPVTTRIAPDRLLGLIEMAMPVLFPLTSMLFGTPLLGRAFRFVLPVANYVEKKDVMSRKLRYEEAILDTFDMLSPRYDRPITPGELRVGLAHLDVDLEIRSAVPVVACGIRLRVPKR